MLKNIQKRSEGFTIIEVLIVLAIAGLIMVVVFIAVPNLQRNARNNRIDTEANALLTAYSEVSNQNSGKKLVAANVDALKKAANLDANSSITTVEIGDGAGTVTTANNVVSYAKFFTAAKCDTSASGATNGTAIAGTSRQVALVHSVEGNGGAVFQCQNI